MAPYGSEAIETIRCIFPMTSTGAGADCDWWWGAIVPVSTVLTFMCLSTIIHTLNFSFFLRKKKKEQRRHGCGSNRLYMYAFAWMDERYDSWASSFHFPDEKRFNAIALIDYGVYGS